MKMETTGIKCISEAFSQQPETRRVGNHIYEWSNGKRIDTSRIISEIKFVGNVPYGERLVGLDQYGEVLFDWVANACNIEY